MTLQYHENQDLQRVVILQVLTTVEYSRPFAIDMTVKPQLPYEVLLRGSPQVKTI